MKAIITKYLPATNTKPSRIKASDGRNMSVIGYPHELSSQQAHAKAATALCKKMGWNWKMTGGGLENGDCVWTFNDSDYKANFADENA
jgi:hypothetical protein